MRKPNFKAKNGEIIKNKAIERILCENKRKFCDICENSERIAFICLLFSLKGGKIMAVNRPNCWQKELKKKIMKGA